MRQHLLESTIFCELVDDAVSEVVDVRGLVADVTV